MPSVSPHNFYKIWHRCSAWAREMQALLVLFALLVLMAIALHCYFNYRLRQLDKKLEQIEHR